MDLILDVLTSDSILYLSVVILAFVGVAHFMIEDLKNQ